MYTYLDGVGSGNEATKATMLGSTFVAEESGGVGEKEIECYSRRVYRLPISLVRVIHAILSVSTSLKRGTEGPCAWSSERARISLFALLEDMSNRPAVENSFVRRCDNWCFDQPLRIFSRFFANFHGIRFVTLYPTLRNFSGNCTVLHLDSIDYREFSQVFFFFNYIFTIYFILDRPAD